MDEICWRCGKLYIVDVTDPDIGHEGLCPECAKAEWLANPQHVENCPDESH